MMVAELVDGEPATVLHDEVRIALVCRVCFENTGDIRVIHAGQRLPFLMKAFHNTRVGQPAEDHLESDDPADRMGLLGAVDGPHASRGDNSIDAVAADVPADMGIGAAS